MPFKRTIITVALSPGDRAGIGSAVHRVVSLTLGQHLLLLISIAVAVRTLLIGRRWHRLVAFYLCGAGVGGGDGWGRVCGGGTLRVEGAVA